MRLNEDVQRGSVPGGTRRGRPAPAEKRARAATVFPHTTPASKTAKKTARAKSPVTETAAGGLPILYMLSPQKFMSPFDCNMAIDSGYKVVLPYDNVSVEDVRALVQDAIFSRPPKARTGLFIGGKDIVRALDMMAAARSAMVPPFEMSVFADPGGSFTTAAAMVACVERVLKRTTARGLEGRRVSVFGATGVVGFASAVIAANAGAEVRIVAHDTLAPLKASARFAAERFGARIEPVHGQTEALKARLLASSDVALTAGPAGVNILSRRAIARSPGLLVAADVNAVAPTGVEGMDLFMDGAPLPGCSTLGIGALAIGDVKYKTQAALFRRMLGSAEPLDLDFRDAFAEARALVSDPPRRARRSGASAVA
ncbi:MAG: NAD(P)-dependent methylenetetrahydromethanopterin dehydrogenase [Hyphomicrobium sp.]|uniref:NAD(P)-dependent methylenetetrahydromethanopterin dehydrogenase n=1 Tax=Hyphomicrobium sp. TaxID=82 RepID=UPI003D0C9000